MDKIKAVIKNSPVWKRINEEVKKIYQQFERVPNDEEYQKVREMILLKVAIEDVNIRNAICNYIYSELKKMRFNRFAVFEGRFYQ